MAFNKAARRTKIRGGIRKKISGTAQEPRLSVYRSNKEIYVQIIDDEDNVTLASANSSEVSKKGTKVEVSAEVGKLIAKKASEKGIKSVVFDRGGYLYHGRVKSLADGAREGGLKF